MVSYSTSIVTMAVSCIVSKIQLDIGRNRDFFIPPTFVVPVSGFLSKYRQTVDYRKTKLLGLPDGEKSLIICLAVSTEIMRMTDKD